MSDRTLDKLEPRVGDTVDSVEDFTVEPGKVEEFAVAVGDGNPVFVDEAAAAERGFDRRPAPPTFTRTSLFPRYRPEGVGRLGMDIGFDIRYELHGEQTYEFARPVFVGDTLSATTTLADAYEREGRQGMLMTFAVLETEFIDDDGTYVLTERQTVIETDGTVTERQQEPDRSEREANHQRASISQPSSGGYPVDSPDDVSVGDAAPTVIVEDIAPQDFVRYAGASGDFNPIHYDEQYAMALGNPGVFGQGMFTAAHAGHLATDWFGVGAIDRFSTRFTARVWPGDTLTVSGEITGVDGVAVSADITATRQTGETVLVGEVTATVSRDA
jgi:acyl dehydratase